MWAMTPGVKVGSFRFSEQKIVSTNFLSFKEREQIHLSRWKQTKVFQLFSASTADETKSLR